jgi:hypothetical protein
VPLLPREKATASERLAQESARLFRAEDDLIATGDLAEYVASVAGRNGVSLEQTETRVPHPVVAGVEALQVEVRAIGDVDGVLQFLQSLETGNKLVRIGRLSLERARQAASTTHPASPSATDMLEISASVYGYKLTGSASAVSDSESLGAPSPFERPTHALPTMIAVADHNPFSPSRQRPVDASAPSIAPPPAPLRHVGTVVSTPARSFAICQRGEAPPKILHVGEQIEGFTLNALARGRAVFATPDGSRLELQAPQPGIAQ